MAGRGVRPRPGGFVASRVAACLVVAASIVLGACGDGDDAEVPVEPEVAAQEDQQAEDTPVESADEQAELAVRELIVTSEDVGAHLEERSYAAGLPSWLEESEDEVLSSLPGRALPSSGVAFSPSDESATGETFWLHVFTDRSEESAADWVKYVASQPPELAGVIVPHHRLFAARFLPAPLVGDASVAIELYRGHSGICVRSALLVFAQGRELIFLFSSIEITRDVDDSSAAAGGNGVPAHCDLGAVDGLLTDIDGIAHLLSARLSATS